MNRYTVNHSYRSRRDGQDFGPWSKGDEVELSDGDAEWVERDSPGTLARQADRVADRQHRGGRNRSAA